MSLGFCTHTSGTGLAIFLDEFSEAGPSVISEYETCCLVLTRMTEENVIVLVAEYTESEIIRVGDVDKIVVSEETIRGNGPVRFRIF